MGNAAISLGGNEPGTINVVASAVIAGICAATAAGCTWDAACHRWRQATQKGRPHGWILAMLAGSYSVLAPGWITVLLSFNVSVSALGHVVPLQVNTETTVSFVAMLFSSGCWLGGACLVLYAFIVPVLKLLLLFLGEFWRLSDSPVRVLWARRCIICVQLISKWASPDMFAYVLLQHLVRRLNHPPHLLAAARLDIGFACFSAFCIGSTVSSVGIRLPAAVGKGDTAGIGTPPRAAPHHSRVVFYAAAACLTAFGVLLGVGLQAPCMALRLDLDVLALPTLVEILVEPLNLPGLAHADVSLWQCMTALEHWSGHGEVTSIVAMLMFGIFVILFTIIDMGLLTAVAWLRYVDSGLAGQKADSLLAAAHVLKKLSMLDVSIVGIMLVALSMGVYRSDGVILSLRWGLYALLGAELLHYGTYHLVSRSAEASGMVHDGQSSCEKGPLLAVE
mmetsp:Transcript_101172/g.326555  ORF Transcript_101172/g.326555 Transcript_101172/m.326555 type:complete len:449 (-) Transcript_101172:37-1383(-)